MSVQRIKAVNPMVNQEESNGKLPPCEHCQESDIGSLSSRRVVLDLMELSTFQLKYQ